MKAPRVRRRPAGDITRLRSAMWQAVVAAEAILLDPHAERADVLRAIHAAAQASAAYQRIIEGHELAERVEALERAADRTGRWAA
jgi:hypothetical protein